MEAGSGEAGVEQHLVEKRETAGGDSVEIHAAEKGGIPATEAAGGVAEGDAGTETDEGGGGAADEQAVAGPVFDERLGAAVAGADDDIGVEQGGEELGNDGGVVGEVGIHGDDGVCPGAERELDTVAHGVAVAAGIAAFQDLHARQLAGGGGGTVGTGVIDDQNLLDGSLGGGDGGDEREEILPLIVCGHNDPHVLQDLHISSYATKGERCQRT